MYFNSYLLNNEVQKIEVNNNMLLSCLSRTEPGTNKKERVDTILGLGSDAHKKRILVISTL